MDIFEMKSTENQHRDPFIRELTFVIVCITVALSIATYLYVTDNDRMLSESGYTLNANGKWTKPIKSIGDK